jgi:hypothetical protein
MKITTAGRDASTEEQAFCYIKGVSGSVTLDLKHEAVEKVLPDPTSIM